MHNLGIHSIEDCLEIITGLQKHSLNFQIDPSDDAIINSIARQVFKGTPLTDRQYILMKDKLIKYQVQFDSQDVIGFESGLNKLRLPLRQIDRSKYIKIIDHKDIAENNRYKFSNSVSQWIQIRFPFNKRTIVRLQNISNRHSKMYFHERGSHTHNFLLTENTIFDIITEFKDSNFEIQQELLDLYKDIETIKSNPTDFVPMLKNKSIFNISDRIKIQIEDKLQNDYLKIVDRRFRLGIQTDIPSGLSGLKSDILNRSDPSVLSKPSQYTLQNTLECIYDLDRFPLLVVLSDDAENEIAEIWNIYKNLVDNEQQVVLFREERQSDFNDFVKDKKLNNWLDKNTKIVYIKNNKVPKLLLKENWNPICALVFKNLHKIVDTYITDKCDLILTRDEHLSLIKHYSRYNNGFL